MKLLTRIALAFALLVTPSIAHADPEGPITADRATMCDDLFPGQIARPELPPCVVTPLNYPTSHPEPIIVGNGDGTDPATLTNNPLPELDATQAEIDAFVETSARTLCPILKTAYPAWQPSDGKARTTWDAGISYVEGSRVDYTTLSYVYTSSTASTAGVTPDTEGSGWVKYCHEAKARFSVAVWQNFPSRDDPIRNQGLPNTAHWHQFAGSLANAFTTWQTARNDFDGLTGPQDRSIAAGYAINRTPYWQPALLTTINKGTANEQKAAIMPPRIAIYYVDRIFNNETDEVNRLFNTPLAYSYVMGYRPDNPEWMIDIIDRANAASTDDPDRYRFSNSAPNTVDEANRHQIISPARITCKVGGVTEEVEWIRNTDGTSAFSGDCDPGEEVIFALTTSDCMDGVNFSTPSGYDHFVPAIYDTHTGQNICPQGWFPAMGVTYTVKYKYEGWASRPDGLGMEDWHFESDTMAGSPWGYTFHMDWFNGWAKTFFRQLEENCVGVGNKPAHECNDAEVGPSAKLKLAGALDGTGDIDLFGTQKVVPLPNLGTEPIMIHPRVSANDNAANDNFVAMGSETHGPIGGAR